MSELSDRSARPPTTPASSSEITAEILERLRTITGLLAGTHTVTDIARISVAEGAAAIGALGGAIRLMSEDGTKLELIDRHHHGAPPEAWLDDPVAVDARTPVAEAARTKVPVFVETPQQLAERFGAGSNPHLPGSKASLPLLVDGRLLGVVAFAFAEWRTLGGRERAFMCVLADVTAQALGRARHNEAHEVALREIEAMSKLKDEFLATVSHELRTPLNAIVGWSSMLKEPLEGDSAKRGVEVIERNARALARLVDDVLDVSRIARGTLRVEHRPVDSAHVVRSALEAVAPAAVAKSIELETVIDDDTGVVIGDPDRLQQVVWNLLSNAVKFTPRGGRVTTTLSNRRLSHHRLSRHRDVVQIVVTDTGVGIEPSFLPHVFETFRQFDSSTTRPHGGLGLGLAIARNIVDLHGGTMAVASGGSGKGAKFTVELPASHPPPADDAAAPAPATKTRTPVPRNVLEGVRVLVADDAADSRDLIRRVLENAGASVRAVASARETMTAMKAWPPDAIVADIGMPDADGYTLMRWIRALDASAGGQVPAIALTGYASEGDRRSALAVGYQEHLSKPTHPSELVRAVARVVGR
ncbi:Two-component hybrid sensor and regulator [Labilithrix luteola]|uniref:histidine kinase n=1 Tax=Labilithrix luteola TaxID=1391654 RepID=A0A0K1QFL9_9BACT|nr:ATP-binding protein [Labilithrix luteola]AKV04523.1 Two-component hybrid sensor and regulator [Labilithrix luteola]